MIGVKNNQQQRIELLGEIVERLVANGAIVCMMDSIYPTGIDKQLRIAQNPTAYASLSLPAILTVLPSGETLWIYVYCCKTRQPRLPLEPILFVSALDVYEVNTLHIVRWRDRVYGLTMDDVWRAIRRVVVPKECAEYWESEREYVARALLPSDVPVAYDDNLPYSVIELYPDRLEMLPDWKLQLDVCFAGCER